MITRDGMEPVVVRTNAEGRYTASGLQPGLYMVVPAKPGLAFDPPYRSVSLPPSSITCNFYAQPQ